MFRKKTKTGDSFSTFAKSDLFAGKTIGSKSFLLVAHSSSTFSYDIAANYGISDDNTLVIKNPNGEIVDKVGWGTANDCDGSCVSNPADNQSLQRKFQSGNFIDTNNNANDFEIKTCPSPGSQSVNCQTTSTATSTSNELTTNHLVISEIQVKGEEQDDEFIEIYNPTNSAISLTDYSIQYLSGTATSTENILKNNFSNSAQIAAKSFYLLANNNATTSLKNKADETYSAFSLSGNSNGAIIFLASSSVHIANKNDPIIVDYFSYGTPGLILSAATSTAPVSNQSLERKANTSSTIDSMINGSNKFSGNGSDTNSGDDFILRNSADPQNSQSFPEPRASPTTPQNFAITYASSSLVLSFNWSASQDYSNNSSASAITYKIINIGASSTFSTIETTSTIATTTISENNFGKTYNFSIQAFDKENFNSASSTASINIPSATLIIAQQSDRSVSELGTGNGQFYQYLGSGLLGSPKSVTFRAKFRFDWSNPAYHFTADFWQSDSPDYGNLTKISSNTCYKNDSNCPNFNFEGGVEKDYTIPVRQNFTFDPNKYYKITFFTYQTTPYFYGSDNSSSYTYGKAAKDNGGGTETDASIVKDLSFKIEASAPIDFPANISQSMPQNFELSYSTSAPAISLTWDKPRYFNETSQILTYKIRDISGLTLVLPEITTSATSTTITLSEVGRKYKFSITGYDANNNATLTVLSKEIFIPYSLLNQFIIAQQLNDFSASEKGNGNGIFYQTAGNGLSGKLGAIAVKISSTGYFVKIDILQYSDSNYANFENMIYDAAGCSSCADYYIDNNVLTLPAKTNFTFDPSKYYKIKFMTYQAQATYYGSADANSYPNGQSTKEGDQQGTEFSTSPMVDLYFAIISATPVR
ncbi:lamin tail domain-containing protein [Candidatus Wolfebacteria bacterium]|nr:lamin tail domain-containing protein [Candidatus Wolfebacteria bacterium]